MDNENLLKSESVLIVDDNPQNLQVLGKLLKENNYRIEFATSGMAALEWIGRRLFDLILLDINMPGMNGFETCIKIRSDPSFDAIPVIFLSADTDRESILKGFELGAQDYITKPFDARELLSRVKTHLALKDSLEKLAGQNLILEDKVAERTEQLNKAVEQLEILNLRLLELDKAKSEFLRLISHEIRTPLNGIIGSTELLKGSEAASEAGELMEILDHSVKRLEKFSLNALLITRLKTINKDINKVPLALSDILNKVLDNRKEIISQRGIMVNTEYLSEKKINGEAGLVKTCFENIIDNAISFVPSGGIFGISIYDEGEFTISNFVDNGPGFNPGSLESIFELFSLGDAKRDNSPGIGLPVCKLIMDAHSGGIQAGNNTVAGAFVRLSFKS